MAPDSYVHAALKAAPWIEPCLFQHLKASEMLMSFLQRCPTQRGVTFSCITASVLPSLLVEIPAERGWLWQTGSCFLEEKSRVY